MIKVFICILIANAAIDEGGVAIVQDIARKEDCQRIGQNWKALTGYGARTYRCIEIYKRIR